MANALGRAKSFVNPSWAELGMPDTSRLPAPDQRPYEKYLKAYADAEWVYTCVSRISQDVAAAPIVLFDKNGEVIENHPSLDLLYKVNGQMTRYDLFEWTQAGLELTGNAYWKLDQITGRGVPQSLWPIIPSMIEIIPSSDPSIFKKGYKYSVNGRIMEFKSEEVIQYKLFNPTDYYYGLSPLAACRLGVDTHLASSKWNLSFLNRSARVDMALTTPHSLKPEQRERMEKTWMQKYGGEEKAHGIAFLEKGTKVEKIGVNAKDMDFVLQKKMTREEICSTFGVLPAMIGLFEYANYANAKEQTRIYWRNTIIPKLKKLVGILNEFYLPLFDPTGQYYFGVLESEIQALRTDEKERSEYVSRYWGMGVPFNTLVSTYSLPFPKIPGGNTSYVPLGVIPAGETPEEPAKPERAAPEPNIEVIEAEKARTTPTRGQLRAKHHRFMLLANNLSKPFQSAMRKYFDVQRDQIVGALQGYEGRKPTLATIGFDIQEVNKKLSNLMRPFLLNGAKAGQDSENLMLSVLTGRRIPEVGQKDLGRINDWVNMNAFAWAEDINLATMRALEKAIETAISEGLGIAEISKRIAFEFQKQRDYRTLRIAQTEVIASLNEGGLEAYRENDQVERKGWLPAYDEATRTTHLEAGAKYGVRGAIGVDDLFQVGAGQGPAPGQIGRPEEDINCRCSIFPVIKKR